MTTPRSRPILPVFALLALSVASCLPPSLGGGRGRAEAGPVILAPGRTVPERELQAVELIARARAAAAAGAMDDAFRGARRVVVEYPETRASGHAALLAAHAAIGAGLPGEVDAVAGPYVEAVGPEDPRAAAVLLLQAGARLETGDAEGALERLRHLGPATPDSVRADAVEVAERAAARLDGARLRAAIEGAPDGWILAGTLRTALERGGGGVTAAPEEEGERAETAVRAAAEARADSLRAATEAGAPRDAFVDAGPGAVVTEPASMIPAAAPSTVLDGAEASLAAGDPHGALALLVRFPNGADPALRERAVEAARRAAADLDVDELGALLRATPLGWPLIGTVQAAYARALVLSGEPAAARRFAETALALGASGEDAAAARTIILDTEPGSGGAGALGLPVAGVTVGALLPASGSPGLQRFAASVQEGIEAAMAASDAPRAVGLEVRDAAADPTAAAAELRALEQGALVGVVGPLVETALRAAAAARDRPLVMISPTATDVSGLESVYSLASPDPGAVRALARYAAASGLDQVVVLHPLDEHWAFEAEAFRQAFEGLGGSVLRLLPYPPGATYFQEQLRQAEALHPQALVLPAPAQDVEALAPQVSFFGLDTLGIRILGTAEWADPGLRRNVAPRHMNGTVVATSQRPVAETEGHRRFREGYEEHFRRTLRDDVAALGWDAASLLLLAVRSGARTPEGLRRAMARIRGFEGATGVLSVEEGRIVREHWLVCVQDGALVDVEPGEAPVVYRPVRRGDPNAGEPERVPMGPVQRFCPGHVPPEVQEAIRDDPWRR